MLFSLRIRQFSSSRALVKLTFHGLTPSLLPCSALLSSTLVNYLIISACSSRGSWQRKAESMEAGGLRWRKRSCRCTSAGVAAPGGQVVAEHFHDVGTAEQGIFLCVHESLPELKDHGQHDKGHMMMPGQPPARLIVGQSQGAFGILKAALDKIPRTGHGYQLASGGVGGGIAQGP